MRDALIFGAFVTKDIGYSADSLNLNLPAKQYTGRAPNVNVVFQVALILRL